MSEMVRMRGVQRSARFSFCLGVAAAAFLSGPTHAEATVVRALTLLEKTDVAPVIVHGLVERVEVDWEVPDAKVMTLVTVKVIEGLEGDHAPGERIIVRRGGGTIGDFSQTAPGLSPYNEGEEVVLFLEPLGPSFVAIGIGIGKYEVEQRGAEKWVTHEPDVAGLRYQDDRPVSIEPIPPMIPETLGTFLKRIRSYLREIPTRPTATPRKGAIKKPPLPLHPLPPR